MGQVTFLVKIFLFDFFLELSHFHTLNKINKKTLFNIRTNF